MAFIFDEFEVSGRLKYIVHQTLAHDFDGDQIGVIRRFDLPSHQDVDMELECLTAQLPGYVAALAGDYLDGDSWIITLERWANAQPAETDNAPTPSGRAALDAHLARALELNDDLVEAAAEEFTVGSLNLRLWMNSHRQFELGELTMTEALRALAVEACGFGSDRLAAVRQTGCAFPDEVHVCEADVYSDVFRGWVEQRVRPGEEV